MVRGGNVSTTTTTGPSITLNINTFNRTDRSVNPGEIYSGCGAVCDLEPHNKPNTTTTTTTTTSKPLRRPNCKPIRSLDCGVGLVF